MKRIAALCVGILLFSVQIVSADCRGCCSRRGGVVCIDGISMCADGTPLTPACVAKTCEVCPPKNTPPTPQPTELVSVASFNIQVFGRTKASKPAVMNALAQTIAQFDVVAIQEIRDKSGTAIVDLERAVDSLGVDYEVVIGPRLGRTSSKEQYALMFKVGVVEVLGAYTYADEGDIFHREPHIVHLKIAGQPFDFVVINIHTDPDLATAEINALPRVIADTQYQFNEKDVILLGDLNADGTYYDENDDSLPLRDNAFAWLITNEMDTNLATSSRTYDRIIITASAVQDYLAGSANVFRFDQVFTLDCPPKAVSDHYPVFADFAVGLDTD